MPRQVVLHATADAVGKRGAIGRAIAIVVMGEADAARDIRSQAMFAAAQHVQSAELKLVDVGVVGVEIGIGEQVVRAIRSVVAVPHELGLKIFGHVVVQEGAKGERIVDAQAIDGSSGTTDVRKDADGIRTTGFIADEGRNFEAPLRPGRNRGQKENNSSSGEPNEPVLHDDDFSFGLRIRLDQISEPSGL